MPISMSKRDAVNALRRAGQDKAASKLELVKQPKKSKYNNRKIKIDGRTFDSLAEAARYQELRLLVKTGAIRKLECQPEYTLVPSFKDDDGKTERAVKYKADFRYIEKGRTVVEDVKGVQTREFRIKWKLLKYQHRGSGIVFRIVEKAGKQNKRKRAA